MYQQREEHVVISHSAISFSLTCHRTVISPGSSANNARPLTANVGWLTGTGVGVEEEDKDARQEDGVIRLVAVVLKVTVEITDVVVVVMIGAGGVRVTTGRVTGVQELVAKMLIWFETTMVSVMVVEVVVVEVTKVWTEEVMMACVMVVLVMVLMLVLVTVGMNAGMQEEGVGNKPSLVGGSTSTPGQVSRSHVCHITSRVNSQAVL